MLQLPIKKWSGRWDSNSRPSGPKPDALTGLRYAPTVTGTAHSSAALLFCQASFLSLKSRLVIFFAVI